MRGITETLTIRVESIGDDWWFYLAGVDDPQYTLLTGKRITRHAVGDAVGSAVAEHIKTKLHAAATQASDRVLGDSA